MNLILIDGMWINPDRVIAVSGGLDGTGDKAVPFTMVYFDADPVNGFWRLHLPVMDVVRRLQEAV